MPTDGPTDAALVTGAASGMGRAVADRFLAEGWDVVGVDLDATGPAGDARYREVAVDIIDRPLGRAAGCRPGRR